MPKLDPKLDRYVDEYGPGNPNPALGRYYVTVINGAQYGLALGPFHCHQDALDMVDAVREMTVELDSWSWFYEFGTCRRYPAKTDPNGVLNEYFTLPAFKRHGHAAAA